MQRRWRQRAFRQTLDDCVCDIDTKNRSGGRYLTASRLLYIPVLVPDKLAPPV
jgi:hypothetical protein